MYDSITKTERQSLLDLAALEQKSRLVEPEVQPNRMNLPLARRVREALIHPLKDLGRATS
jgi:hypothetical protein